MLFRSVFTVQNILKTVRVADPVAISVAYVKFSNPAQEAAIERAARFIGSSSACEDDSFEYKFNEYKKDDRSSSMKSGATFDSSDGEGTQFEDHHENDDDEMGQEVEESSIEVIGKRDSGSNSNKRKIGRRASFSSKRRNRLLFGLRGRFAAPQHANNDPTTATVAVGGIRQ